MDGNPAPIALFANKRPEQTLRTLESLAANSLADESHLFIFCDGPETVVDSAAVAKVRSVARRRPWCERVVVIERDGNLGPAQSIRAGVSGILAKHESVIVLGDDLELSPRFLEFMNHALYHYRNKPRVIQVSGYMFPLSLPGAPETCFLPILAPWGWGTWRRAWRLLDSNSFRPDGLALFPGSSYVRHAGAGDGELAEKLVTYWPQEIMVTEPAYSTLLSYFRDGGFETPAALGEYHLPRLDSAATCESAARGESPAGHGIPA
ncbi:MAG: hypothetical protein HY040_10790 [Planctomycetes bacterium]|nr:hypothetical protein [Planctomycetota bacterium]